MIKTIKSREELRLFVLADEQAYLACYYWMEETARAEGKDTYLDNGITYHKNFSELSSDGYFDRYISALYICQ